MLTRIHYYSSDTCVTKQVVKKYHPEEKTRQIVGYVCERGKKIHSLKKTFRPFYDGTANGSIVIVS